MIWFPCMSTMVPRSHRVFLTSLIMWHGSNIIATCLLLSQGWGIEKPRLSGWNDAPRDLNVEKFVEGPSQVMLLVWTEMSKSFLSAIFTSCAFSSELRWAMKKYPIGNFQELSTATTINVHASVATGVVSLCWTPRPEKIVYCLQFYDVKRSLTNNFYMKLLRVCIPTVWWVPIIITNHDPDPDKYRY